MGYKVLARKYRPQLFEEVVGQEHVTRTLKNTVASGRIAQGYLFSGMRGVGKTTMARILAKALDCEQGPTATPCNGCTNCTEITEGYSVDVLEVDGASNTSVDDVRELRENVLYTPARTRYKIYIIDEVHMLSKSAFNALLKTLEEPPPHVIFIFATTEPHKVPITIKSRCQCFHFRRISTQKITDHLLGIAEKEGVSLGTDSALLIGRASEGSMRDAQSLFDQILSFCGDQVTLEDAKLVLGVIDYEVLEECTQGLVEQDAERVLNLVDSLHGHGADLGEFCKGLQAHLRNLLMVKILKDPTPLVTLSPKEMEALRGVAESVEEERLLSYVEQVSRAEEQIRRSTHPKILLELALVKMARVEPLRNFKEVLVQLEDLTRKLGGSEGDGRVQADRAPGKPGKGGDQAFMAQPPALRSGSGSPSVLSEHWENLVNYAHKVYPLLGSLLENGFLETFDKDRVTVGFKKKIHYEMAMDKKDKIDEMLVACLERKVRLSFTLSNGTEAPPLSLTEEKEKKERKKQAQLRKENLGNPVVQEALKVFKGEVLEVRDFGAEPQGR